MTRKVDVKVERSGNKKRASMTCATGLRRMTSGPRRAKRRPVQIASRLEASKGSKRDKRKDSRNGNGKCREWQRGKWPGKWKRMQSI